MRALAFFFAAICAGGMVVDLIELADRRRAERAAAEVQLPGPVRSQVQLGNEGGAQHATPNAQHATLNVQRGAAGPGFRANAFLRQ